MNETLKLGICIISGIIILISGFLFIVRDNPYFFEITFSNFVGYGLIAFIGALFGSMTYFLIFEGTK